MRISASFPLSGNLAMSITTCAATGTPPFIVLRSGTTGLAATYVDPVNHLTKLTGKYNVEITPAPTCVWAIDIVPE